LIVWKAGCAVFFSKLPDVMYNNEYTTCMIIAT